MGKYSKAEQHIPNLIKLLAKLTLPKQYQIWNGLGELEQYEFDEDTQEDLAYYWGAQNLYNTVLPFGKTVLNQIFNNETSFGVFYYGYSYKGSTPHVWMSEVKIPSYDYTNKVSVDKFTFKSGEIGWKRTQDAGCDFRNYAKEGVQTGGTRIKDLPEYGLVVRYKSGNQLIDKSGNDKDMTKSFTAFSKNIEDIFVYKNTIAKEEAGEAVVGSFIRNTDDYIEICALNSSVLTENRSLFFKYYAPGGSSKTSLILQSLNDSKYAYVNLLNSLMHSERASDMDVDDYYKFSNIWSNYPPSYKSCINNLCNDNVTYKEFGIDDLKNLVNFKYNKNEKYFSLSFPYQKEGQYGEAELRYYFYRDAYKIITKASKFDESKAMLSLNSYRDTQLDMALKEGQTLVLNVDFSERKSAQEQTIQQLKSLKFE